MTLARQSFGKAQRLLKAGDFKRVFDRACFRLSSPGFVILVRKQPWSMPRLGLVMSKRNSRRAVDRNRIKRIVRESFRQHGHGLGGYDFVVMSRSGTRHIANAELHVQLRALWDDARSRIERQSKDAPRHA